MSTLTLKDLNRLTQLAHLDAEPAQEEHLLTQLNSFFDMVKEMQAVDTQGVEPLLTPLAVAQNVELRFRDDVVTEPASEVARDLAQKNSPTAQDGFYIVPKVIE